VTDLVGIAAIRHHFREPPTHPELALRLSQQQQTGIGRLVAAVKIYCFLRRTLGRSKGSDLLVNRSL
jgi:hypothetical protein